MSTLDIVFQLNSLLIDPRIVIYINFIAQISPIITSMPVSFKSWNYDRFFGDNLNGIPFIYTPSTWLYKVTKANELLNRVELVVVHKLLCGDGCLNRTTQLSFIKYNDLLGLILNFLNLFFQLLLSCLHSSHEHANSNCLIKWQLFSKLELLLRGLYLLQIILHVWIELIGEISVLAFKDLLKLLLEHLSSTCTKLLKSSLHLLDIPLFGYTSHLSLETGLDLLQTLRCDPCFRHLNYFYILFLKILLLVSLKRFKGVKGSK